MSPFTESVVEQTALAWFESLGWSVRHGFDIAPGEAGAERSDYAQVVLEARLRDALIRLNPALPAEDGRQLGDSPALLGHRPDDPGSPRTRRLGGQGH